MSKYITPRIDEVLAREGYWRPNEAPVYLLKRPRVSGQWNSSGEYMVVFPIPAINLTSMESWFDNAGMQDKIPTVEKAIRMFTTWSAVTYATKNVGLYELVLMLTADFYYHELDWLNADRYIRYYEAVSGNRYQSAKHQEFLNEQVQKLKSI